MTTYTLYELNFFLKQVIALNFREPFWVRCEIAQVKLSRGHYYIDLVQKEEYGEEIVAKGQAVLWAGNYQKLLRKFGLDLQAFLQEGLEVMILANLSFHELYGMKVSIEDFDPAFSIGKMELKRRETIRQLRQQNMLEKNKAIELPSVIQQIAIISSETAAGYQDFLKQLHGNPYGYKFNCAFFQATMQGNLVESEIIEQLSRIEKTKGVYDCIVVIRGGGAKLDLVSFDSLNLCLAAANSSIPILTGIGHDIDETVLDMVAHTPLKTPTAVAEHIIQHNLLFESELKELGMLVNSLSARFIKNEDLRLQHHWQNLNHKTLNQLNRYNMMLDYINREITPLVRYCIRKESLSIDSLEENIRLLSPEVTMKRGFSMTLHKGKVLTSATGLKPGAEIQTHFFSDSVESVVKKVNHE